MKTIRYFLLFTLFLVPVFSFAQQISNPSIVSTDDPSTKLIEVTVNQKYTVLTFEHIGSKGSWIQVNKSMYLQDADGEEKYEFVKAESIPLRPEKYTFDKNGSLVFKVYFQKLKPETKAMNVIERALTPQERNSSIGFLNYYGVDLTPSQSLHKAKETEVLHTAQRPEDIMTRMFTQVLTTQLNFYGKPETIDLLAKIVKNYFDALITKGFTEEQVLKIVTSTSFIPDRSNK